MNTKKYLNIKYLSSQPLFANVASLGLVQIANYLIPIIIVPFVVRALGAEAFGRASYAQNIVSYLTILVNFGFDYSATQDVAINRENKNALRNIFWTVIRFKTWLLLISFVILGCLYFFSKKVNDDPLLYFYAALINIGFVFFPNWFFQGMEKMARMSIFNFVIKFIGAVLVVLIVSAPTDYRLYLLILSLSFAVVGLFAFVYVINKYELRGSNCVFEKSVINKSFPIFLNNLFVSLYAIVGVTIIGAYLSDFEVGIYSGFFKIIMAVNVLSCLPLSVAVFPVVSRKFEESFDDGWMFFKKMLLVSVIWGLAVSVMTYILTPYVARIFLGQEFAAYDYLMRMMAPLPTLVIVATMLTVQGLYGMKMQRFAPWVGAFSGGFSLMLNMVLVNNIGLLGAVYAWVGAQCFEIVLVYLILRYRRG